MESSKDPMGHITNKVYDKVGRLSKVIVGEEETIYRYYDNGNRESVTYPDGTREEYSYNANNQIKTLENKKADGTIIDSYQYSYDKAGNQTRKYEIINGKEKGETIYTYDVLNRLLTVTEPNGRTTSCTYDKAGNRETETIVAKEVSSDSGQSIVITTVNTYKYNSQNRLTEITTKVNNVLREIINYSYDHNGNQLTSAVKTYDNGIETASKITVTNSYDLRNQLIQTVTENGAIVRNSYNAEGYRTVKEVDGEKTYYLYEADKVILELDDNGSQKARNVYGTNLLMRTVNGESYYYLYNGHGDVVALLAEEGTIAATYYYDAFGNILDSTGEVDNNILYSGYQYDEETGLYYLNARMYDPKIARFLQEDTYTGNPNDPLSLNLYTYCANNPIVYWDPTGHFLKKIGKKAYKAAVKVVDATVSFAGSVTGEFLDTVVYKPMIGVTKLGGTVEDFIFGSNYLKNEADYMKTQTDITVNFFKGIGKNKNAHSVGEFVGDVTGQALIIAGTGNLTSGVGSALNIPALSQSSINTMVSVGTTTFINNYAEGDLNSDLLIDSLEAGYTAGVIVAGIEVLKPVVTKVATKVGEKTKSVIGKYFSKGAGKTFTRNLENVNELNPNSFTNLKNNGVITVNKSGSDRPLTSTSNSYYKTANGEHVFIYDEGGKLIYDLSSQRVKSFKINVNPAGKEFYSDYKLSGAVPDFIKNIFGW